MEYGNSDTSFSSGCLAVVVWLAMFFLFGWFVMLLWNGVAVPLFEAPAIGYWSAIGLYLLSNMLLKPDPSNSNILDNVIKLIVKKKGK